MQCYKQIVHMKPGILYEITKSSEKFRLGRVHNFLNCHLQLEVSVDQQAHYGLQEQQQKAHVHFLILRKYTALYMQKNMGSTPGVLNLSLLECHVPCFSGVCGLHTGSSADSSSSAIGRSLATAARAPVKELWFLLWW